MTNFDYVKTSREEAVKNAVNQDTPFAKRMGKLFSKLNVWVYKLSFGKLWNTAMGGYSVCIVGMIGKKSGKKIEIPLIHVPYGENKIMVGSMGGLDRNPGWVYSVKANPEVTITADGKKRQYTCRQVSDDEKRELWPHLTSIYPHYDSYQARTDRNIPVFLCEPKP